MAKKKQDSKEKQEIKKENEEIEEEIPDSIQEHTEFKEEVSTLRPEDIILEDTGQTQQIRNLEEMPERGNLEGSVFNAPGEEKKEEETNPYDEAKLIYEDVEGESETHRQRKWQQNQIIRTERTPDFMDLSRGKQTGATLHRAVGLVEHRGVSLGGR